MLSFIIIVIVIRLVNFLIFFQEETPTFYMMKTVSLLKETNKGKKTKKALEITNTANTAAEENQESN